MFFLIKTAAINHYTQHIAAGVWTLAHHPLALELDSKTLLSKMTHASVAAPTAIKLELSSLGTPWWRVSIVPGCGIQAAGRERSSLIPTAVNLQVITKTDALRVTNSLIWGSFHRGNSDLVLYTHHGQKTMISYALRSIVVWLELAPIGSYMLMLKELLWFC